jgi:hypothetical protein
MDRIKMIMGGLAMLLLATFVFSQSAAATVATENWPISSAPEYGFEIKYPPSWQIGLEG